MAKQLPSKPIGCLYNCQPDCYNRVPYFRQKSKELIEHILTIVKKLKMNAELRLVSREIHYLWVELLSTDVRVLVAGSGCRININKLVQRVQAGCRQPTLVYDITAKSFGGKLLDVIICQQHELTSGCATEHCTVYRQAAASKQLLIIREDDTNVNRVKSPEEETVSSAFATKLPTFHLEGFEELLCDLNEISARISVILERQILGKLVYIHQGLQSVLKSLWHLPIDAISATVLTILKQRNCMGDLKSKFRAKNETAYSLNVYTACHHGTDETELPCSECFLIYKLSHTLGNSITNVVFEDFQKNYQRISPRKWYFKEYWVEVSRQIQKCLVDLFRSRYSQKGSIETLFENSEITDLFLTNILDLCREQLLSHEEDIVEVCHRILSLLNQSNVPCIKDLLGQISNTKTTDELRKALFERCASVKSVGYQFDRLKVEVNPHDYKENGLGIESIIREIVGIYGIDPMTVAIKPVTTVSKYNLQSAESIHGKEMVPQEVKDVESKVQTVLVQHRDKLPPLDVPLTIANGHPENHNGSKTDIDIGAKGIGANTSRLLMRTEGRKQGGKGRDKVLPARVENANNQGEGFQSTRETDPFTFQLYHFNESLFPKYRYCKNMMKNLEKAVCSTDHDSLFMHFGDSITVLVLGDNSFSMDNILQGYQDVRDITVPVMDSQTLGGKPYIIVVPYTAEPQAKFFHALRQIMVSPHEVLFINMTTKSSSEILEEIKRQVSELSLILPEAILTASWEEIRHIMSDVLERRVLQNGVRLEERCKQHGTEKIMSDIHALYKKSSLQLTAYQIIALKTDLVKRFGDHYRGFTPDESAKMIRIRMTPSEVNKNETGDWMTSIRLKNRIFHRLVCVSDEGGMHLYSCVGARVKTNDGKHGSLGGFADVNCISNSGNDDVSKRKHTDDNEPMRESESQKNLFVNGPSQGNMLRQKCTDRPSQDQSASPMHFEQVETCDCQTVYINRLQPENPVNHVGDAIHCDESKHKGTILCFLLELKNESHLVRIATAKHIACDIRCGTYRHVYSNTFIGNETISKFDISVISIDNFSDCCKIDSRFQNSRGETRTARLVHNCKLKTDLLGNDVHLFGSKTRPGKGIIVKGPGNLENDEDFIWIKDKNIGTAFCNQGDSGTAVLMDAPDDTHVNVIGILSGQVIQPDDDPLYLAVDISRILRHLRVETGTRVFPFDLNVFKT